MKDGGMTHFDNDDPIWRAAVFLKDASPRFFTALVQALRLKGRRELAAQLERVVVAFQIIGGEPNVFWVLAYAVPTPTPEELRILPAGDEEMLNLCVFEGKVTLDVDLFGFIKFIHVEGLPWLYRELVPILTRR